MHPQDSEWIQKKKDNYKKIYSVALNNWGGWDNGQGIRNEGISEKFLIRYKWIGFSNLIEDIEGNSNWRRLNV